uniref:BTB domain-containing protein n=1 Tax=Arcella intermedia TaxID=1963864 RepID=A0A6B2LNB8_9EUKA
MFTNAFKELKSPQMQIQDVDEEIFQQILSYIYKDELKVDEKNWQELLQAGSRFCIEGVVDSVGKYLLDEMGIENVVGMFNVYLQYKNELGYLLDKIRYVVGYYHQFVVETEAFKKLEKEKKEVLDGMKINGDWDYGMVKKENCILQ